ncbi:MAG: pilus assembly PilX N-terminal domain-containing protein [Candidatus Saccharimonadales bacterium]
MTTNKYPNQVRKSESGMVAVMVTLIMIIVISLIVIGFAQVSRRTQRSSLDTQLSTQAFYAAESGLNDTLAIMRNAINTNNPILPKATCANGGMYASLTAASVIGNAADNVSYTCVIVDPAPTKLKFKLGAPSLDTSSTEVIKLKSSGGQAFNTITYSWVPAPGQSAQPLANCPGAASQYPVATGAAPWNCKFPVLRTELTPTNVLSRDGLMDNTHVNFLEPVRAGGGGNYVWATDNAKSVAANCAAVCTATVNFSGAGVNSYYLRINTLYLGTSLTISAKDALGADIGFADAQAQISVTGKAQDVLRRILVAVSLDAVPKSSPSSALMSGDSVCKRFMVTAGSFDGPATDILGAPGNPLCDAGSSGTPTNP